MTTKYTPQQIAEFREFCLRHDIVFAIIAEYKSALDQFFLEG